MNASSHCCCPPVGYYKPILVGLFGGCRPFLERAQIIAADRCPSPRLAPGTLDAEVCLQPPLPLPLLQAYLTGLPPPDRGRTENWPYPRESEPESEEISSCEDEVLRNSRRC